MISRIVTRLEELAGDVDLTGLADGKVLAYEAASSKWKPVTVSTSIDSEDVTTALGYTPVNPASPTLTGALSVDLPNGFTGTAARVRVNSVEKWSVDENGQIITPQVKIWRNGGTGTALEFLSQMTGTSAGIYFTAPNVTDVLRFSIANSYGLVVSRPTASSTQHRLFYGGWSAYQELYDTARYSVRGGAGIELSLGADDLEWLRLGTTGQLSLMRASSTTRRAAALLEASLPVSTDASRTGRGILSAVDYAATRECIRWEADGSAARLGFYGGSAVTKPVVSGAHGSNAALQSLLTALVNLGLITDSTS